MSGTGGASVTLGAGVSSRSIITGPVGLPDFEEATAVSWLPLYHDMGLIGFVISPVFRAMNAVYIPTLRFLKRPNCWMTEKTQQLNLRMRS